MSALWANVGSGSLSTSSEVGESGMEEVRREGTVEVLERLHLQLGSHFRGLHEAREQLTPTAPVFAL